MQLTGIHIKLGSKNSNRLKAYCALTFDNTFVIHDVKVVEGNNGLFIAMPARKVCDHCSRCKENNHLRARYCNNCGTRLDENRSERQPAQMSGRLKLHVDIAHPIDAHCRHAIEGRILTAYHDEVERSKQPGYVPPSYDGDDMDNYDSPVIPGPVADFSTRAPGAA